MTPRHLLLLSCLALCGCSGAGGEGTGRSLGQVPCVPRNPVLRHHGRPHELEAVELRSRLKQRPPVLGECMQLEHIPDGLVRDS